MIIPNRYNETESSQEFPATEFSIKASAEAFRFLSDKLYTDKPMAIVREIYTNAYDVHAVTKQDRSVEVHLPTYEEPYLSIKDFGCGLDELSVRGLYSTLFESTKRNTNEQAGMLGLGRVSVLSYTDSFTVKSRYGGVISVYNIFINGKGIPSVVKLSEEPTDEPNGLEVSCAVALGDCNRFTEAARKFFARVEKLPKFNNSFTPDRIVYTADGGGWKARNVNYGERAGLIAVVGPVAYPVTIPSSSIPSDLHYLLSANLDLFFNIGEVDVAMSRESLSLDERTIEVIIERLRKINDEAAAKLNESLSKFPNAYRARRELSRVTKQHGSLYYGLRASKAEYGGKPLNTFSTPIFKQGDINTPQLFKFSYRRGRNVLVQEDITSLETGEDYLFFIDKKCVSKAKFRAYMNDNGVERIVYIKSENAAETLKALGLEGEKYIARDAFPTKTRSLVYSDKGLAPCLTFVPSTYYYGSDMGSNLWELPEEEPDADEEVVYVKMARYGVNGDKADTQRVSRRLKAIRECGGPEVEIYGLRKELYLKAAANKNWITFDSWFEREAKKLRKVAEGKAKMYNAYDEFANDRGYLKNQIKGLPATHIISQILSLIHI